MFLIMLFLLIIGIILGFYGIRSFITNGCGGLSLGSSIVGIVCLVAGIYLAWPK